MNKIRKFPGEETLETYTVLGEIEQKFLKLINKDGFMSLKEIAKNLNISKGYASKIASKLEHMGLIKRLTIRPASFKLTDLGRSFLNNKGGVCFRVDALRVYAVVKRVGGGVVDWLEGVCFQRVGMRGWVKYRVRFDDRVFVEVNLADLNPSVEIVFDRLWTDSISFLSGAFLGYVFGYVWRVATWLYKHGLVIDLDSIRITSHEFEARVPDRIARELPDGVYRVDLGRPAVNLLGQPMNVSAKAWIDDSLGPKEHGSNDFPYWYKFLMQPEVLWDLRQAIYNEFIPAIKLYTQQINEHLQAVKDIRDYIRELRDLQRRPNRLNKIKNLFSGLAHRWRGSLNHIRKLLRR